MTRARLQVSLRRLMLFVLVSGLLFWIYQNAPPALSIPATLILGLAVGFARVVRDHRSRAAWGFGLASLAVNGLVGYFCTYRLSIIGGAMMAFAVLGFLPPALGFGFSWARLATRAGTARRWPRWLAWPLVVILGVSPVTMMVAGWPIRLAFRASRPALDAMADRVAGGRPLARPEWAGFYRVVKSKFDPATGEVALIIDDDPAGRSGFLRLPTGQAECRSGLFRNLDFNVPLAERWWYQNED